MVLAGVSGLHTYLDKKNKGLLNKKLKNFDINAFVKKVEGLDQKIEELQNRKDFVPIEELEGFQSQLSELSDEVPNVEDFPTKDEIKNIIDYYEDNKKKMNDLSDVEIQRQNRKLNSILHRAKSEIAKTQRLIKSNYRKILVNTKRTKENKAAGASNLKKIVSSNKTKI